MFIADSQVHIWAADTPARPWLSKPITPRTVPLGTDELLREMDAAGVSRALLIPPGFDGIRNDLILAAAQKYPDRFGAVGRLDTKAPDAPDRIAKWLEQPGMLGMRFSFNRKLGPALADGSLEWVWRAAEKSGVPVMVLVPHAMVQLMDDIAGRYPDLKLALCHMGLPTDRQDAAAFGEFDKLLSIARRPNVMIKASALPTYTTDRYPFRALHPYLRRVYDAFGPGRIFWGTDFSRLTCSYREAITMFTEEIPWLTAADKETIMGRGLCEWLGWKLPAA